MLNAGVDLAVVSKALGHANVSVTASIYAHVLTDTLSEAGDTLAAALER